MKDCDGNLTETERKRNIHGPMLQYDYCPTDQGPLNQTATYGEPKVYHVYCTEKLIYRDEVGFFFTTFTFTHARIGCLRKLYSFCRSRLVKIGWY